MCATELFAIHDSVLNHKTSTMHSSEKTKPKPTFFAMKPTVHKNLETATKLMFCHIAQSLLYYIMPIFTMPLLSERRRVV